MAHLRRNLNTPPPMSPATTNAHNFYNTFAPRRGGNSSPPPSMYQNPQTTQQSSSNNMPPRPASAVPSQSAGNSSAYYQTGSNYVNAQYYRDERQYPANPQSPQLQPGYSSMNVSGGGGANRARSPPPPSGIPPKSSAYSRPAQSATYAPNHPGYGRPSPPPLNINNVNGSYNSAGSNIRRPASAAGATSRMPGAFPDEIIREQTPRNDLPLRNNPNIIGVKAAAAARQRDQVLEQPEEEAEAPRADSFWGDLFDKSESPPSTTAIASQFLRGVADYIITEFEPKNSIVITPPKMMAFYTKFKSPGGERLSWEIPPKDSSSSPPTVPSLTPQGFERWMTIQILSDPDREAKRLITVLKQCPIQNPFEKDPMLRRFPKTLSRESFPKFADGDVRRLWDLFVPDDEQQTPAATTAARPGNNPPPSRGMEQDQREREQRERERERDQRVLEVLQDRDTGSRSITPRGGAGGYAPPPNPQEDDTIPEHLRGERWYESRPPPPLPNDNGIERERSPYSRTIPMKKEDVTRPEYDDDDYDRIHHPYGYENVNPNVPLSPHRPPPVPTGPSIPPKTRPLSPPLSGTKKSDKRISDFDREEEDLYKIMAAKRAEIAAIEERLKKQASAPQEHIPMPHVPEMTTPDLADGYDSDEEAAIRQRAEEDWDREAREREKWVEARRRRLEMESRGEGEYDADFQAATPISHYSWRDSYTSPAPVVVKRNTPQNLNAGRTRLSGGGEWEEFRVDEAPSGRRPSVSHHDRQYSGGGSGWPREHYP
ncbi:hypothetical protein AA313_de0204979 [Arthrobotrys entomopaga]|nr:hypothetical protein AA313_de0204979 [Arthrobotrys entomopaga]